MPGYDPGRERERKLESGSVRGFALARGGAFGGGAQSRLVEQRFVRDRAATLAHDRSDELGRALAALLVEKLFAGLRLHHRSITEAA